MKFNSSYSWDFTAAAVRLVVLHARREGCTALCVVAVTAFAA